MMKTKTSCIFARHGTANPKKKFQDGGDYVIKGVSFKGKSTRRNDILGRHLKTEIHLEAIKRKEIEEKQNKLMGWQTHKV